MKSFMKMPPMRGPMRSWLSTDEASNQAARHFGRCSCPVVVGGSMEGIESGYNWRARTGWVHLVGRGRQTERTALADGRREPDPRAGARGMCGGWIANCGDVSHSS